MSLDSNRQTETGAKSEEKQWNEYFHIIPCEINDPSKMGTIYRNYHYSSSDTANRGKAAGAEYEAYKTPSQVHDWLLNRIYKKYKNIDVSEDLATYKYSENGEYPHYYNNQDQVNQYKMFFEPSYGVSGVTSPFPSLSTERTNNGNEPMAQLGTDKKRELLYGTDTSMYEIATKTIYLLQHGRGGVDKYKADKAANNVNYKEMKGRAVRLLWLEYEEDQLHRGIDFYPEENTAIYPLCSGIVVKRKNYALYLYNSVLDITVIYCHLNQDKTIKFPTNGDGIPVEWMYDEYGWPEPYNEETANGRARYNAKGYTVPVSRLIGTVGRVRPDTRWPDEQYPPHVHVEIMKGKYTGTIEVPKIKDEIVSNYPARNSLDTMPYQSQISDNPYDHLSTMFGKQY